MTLKSLRSLNFLRSLRTLISLNAPHLFFFRHSVLARLISSRMPPYFRKFSFRRSICLKSR